jgi:hypothetical protein
MEEIFELLLDYSYLKLQIANPLTCYKWQI